MITIPKSFQIMGHTIKVIVTNKLDSDRVGEYDAKECTIRVRPQPKSMQDQTYFHELVHCILTHLSYDDQNSDEQFVDTFSQCLYQVLKTGKGSHG